MCIHLYKANTYSKYDMTPINAKIAMKEKAKVTIMEPIFTGYDSVTWKETEIVKNLWQCTGCGLVWQMKHEAEKCEGRKHAPRYVRYYGGYFENGVHRGGKQIEFYAVRREKPAAGVIITQ